MVKMGDFLSNFGIIVKLVEYTTPFCSETTVLAPLIDITLHFSLKFL